MPPLVGGQRLDEPEPLEPVQRAVERARPELDLRELPDVLDQRVAVLRPVGQADQDQHRRLPGPAQHVLFSCAHLPSYYVHQYISKRNSQRATCPRRAATHAPATDISSGALASPAPCPVPSRPPHRTTSMWQRRCCKGGATRRSRIKSHTCPTDKDIGVVGDLNPREIWGN